MTVGIICLDGLDHRLVSDHGVFDPAGVQAQPLLNDLDGEHPLFTPRVWNSLFLGEDQREITGWLPEPKWETATRKWVFLWDKVPSTACLNLNLHTNYFSQNATIPNGWTPAHGTFDQMQETTLDLIGHWNDTLEELKPPVQIAYWRLPDAYGHQAGKHGWPMADVYDWIRDRFWEAIDLPERWICLSDHGFARQPDQEPESSAGKKMHRPSATVAATWNVDVATMSGFIPVWHDQVLEQVNLQHLDAMGYTD